MWIFMGPLVFRSGLNAPFAIGLPSPAIMCRERCYLVSGYLGEDVHHHVQGGVDESLLQLLVFGLSVLHFVILPLLEPLVVGKRHQTQGGLPWSEGNTYLGLSDGFAVTVASASHPVAVPGDLSSQVGSLADGEATKSRGMSLADSSLFPFKYFSTLLRDRMVTHIMITSSTATSLLPPRDKV